MGWQADPTEKNIGMPAAYPDDFFTAKQATMNSDNERDEYTCEDQCLAVADGCISRREIDAESSRANFIHCVEACQGHPDRELG